MEEVSTSGSKHQEDQRVRQGTKERERSGQFPAKAVFVVGLHRSRASQRMLYIAVLLRSHFLLSAVFAESIHLRVVALLEVALRAAALVVALQVIVS